MVESRLTVGERIRALEAACQEVFRNAPDRVQAVFLYGSSLGPGLRQDSDIDIAVLDPAEDRLTWREQAHLADRLERAIGRPVDLRMLRDGSLSYQAHVLEQGRRVWISNPGELESYSHETLTSAATARRRTEEEWPRVLRRLAHR